MGVTYTTESEYAGEDGTHPNISIYYPNAEDVEFEYIYVPDTNECGVST